MTFDIQTIYETVKDELLMHEFEVSMVDAGWRTNVDAFTIEIVRKDVLRPLYHHLVFTGTEMAQCSSLTMLREIIRDKLREIRKLRKQIGCTA